MKNRYRSALVFFIVFLLGTTSLWSALDRLPTVSNKKLVYIPTDFVRPTLSKEEQQAAMQQAAIDTARNRGVPPDRATAEWYSQYQNILKTKSPLDQAIQAFQSTPIDPKTNQQLFVIKYPEEQLRKDLTLRSEYQEELTQLIQRRRDYAAQIFTSYVSNNQQSYAGWEIRSDAVVSAYTDLLGFYLGTASASKPKDAVAGLAKADQILSELAQFVGYSDLTQKRLAAEAAGTTLDISIAWLGTAVAARGIFQGTYAATRAEIRPLAAEAKALPEAGQSIPAKQIILPDTKFTVPSCPQSRPIDIESLTRLAKKEKNDVVVTNLERLKEGYPTATPKSVIEADIRIGTDREYHLSLQLHVDQETGEVAGYWAQFPQESPPKDTIPVVAHLKLVNEQPTIRITNPYQPGSLRLKDAPLTPEAMKNIRDTLLNFPEYLWK